MDDGETHEEAALRELREETGLTDVEIGPWIWTHDHEMTWLGEPVLMQERFFLARSPTDRIDVSGFDEFERTVLTEHRWWSVEDLEEAERSFGPDETLAPKDLPRLLGRSWPVACPPSPFESAASPRADAAATGPAIGAGPTRPARGSPSRDPPPP